MKEEMYTYHYYKSRSVVKPEKTSDFLVRAAVVFGLAYAALTLSVMFRG
ncbi:MAG TPA: hypothetical protein PKA10_02390 [Selenomonadales bacterium]|nr:hypothetical protein [Selenomonadales bacterium]